jgi:hypothetical protein
MAADLSALFRAKNPLIWIVTQEEARVERSILDAAKASTYDVRYWDCSTGTSDAAGKQVTANGDPQAVVAAIRDTKQRCVWVLRDIHLWLRDPMVLRGLRSLARTLPQAERLEARSVVILSPSSEVPPELQGHTVVINWPLPDREEITQILDACIAGLPPEIASTVTPLKREAAIDAAIGLNAEEASAAYSQSIVTLRTVDPETVAAGKKRVIAREKVLELFDPDPRGLAAVGGLDSLKDWLTVRRSAFSQKARDFGLPSPKGALLVGVPGCGKSLTAKAIAAAWGMPLLRLDLGALQSKWVGESQANIRKAFALAETIAPAILWIDEIEKALAGAASGAADGGVSTDALGALLSWMQDRKAPVFVVATSNDVSALPPELLRKGRFDEIFWVDLPTAAERSSILTATLAQYKRTADGLDLAAVATATRDFTGSEVAELVPSALFPAFADGERGITTADLITMAGRTVPLAKTAAEKIERLRKWAAERARPASAPEVAAPVGVGRKLDL